MKKILTIVALIFVAACQTAPQAYVPEPFDFSQKPPLRIQVAEIRMVENYRAPLRAPNVEHTFPISPASALRTWAKQRLIATGTSGVMEVVIDDASVKEVKLPKTQGIKGLFTDDQEARYDATIHITLRVFSGERALSDATGDISISRSRSINERATIDERARQFHGITREMMVTYDTQAEARLRQYFSKFLR